MHDAFGGTKRQWNRKLRMKAKEKEMDTRSWHSLFYHRYFEGYTEYTKTSPDGKRRIVRKYTGTIYRQSMPPLFCVLLRIVYLLLFAVMIYFTVRTATTPRSSDTVWYLAVTELATLLFLSFLLYNLLVDYLFLSGNLTIGDYRSSSKGIIHKAAGLCVCFAADAAGTVLYLLLHGQRAGAADRIAVNYFLGSAVCALIMFLLEKNVPYTAVQPPEREADDGGIEILYKI